MTPKILEKSSVSFKTAEGQKAQGQAVVEMGGLNSKAITVVKAERGQTYKITEGETQRAVKPAKIERLGTSLVATLEDEQTLELLSFFDDEQAQLAEFVFPTDDVACPWSIIESSLQKTQTPVLDAKGMELLWSADAALTPMCLYAATSSAALATVGLAALGPVGAAAGILAAGVIGSGGGGGEPVGTNSAPVLTLSTPVSPLENAAAAGQTIVRATATDAEGSALTFSLVPGSNPNNYYAIDPTTGVVTLTAAGAAHVNAGNDLPAVQVSVTDGTAADTETAAVPTTTDVNDAPVLSLSTPGTPLEKAAFAGQTISSATATDEEGHLLFFSLVAGSNPNAYYAIDIFTGVVTLTAAGATHVNAGGNLPAVQVRVVDAFNGLDTESVTVPATTQVNDAPVANPATITPTEDTPLAVPLAATDVDGTIASFTLTAGPTPAQGSLVYDHDGAPSTPAVAVPINSPLTLAQAATVQFVPALNHNGAVSPISFFATDNQGLASAPATVTINPVTPVNDAPVATPATITPTEDTPLAVPLAATDVDGTIVSFTLIAGPTPAQGSLVYDADGDPATPAVAVPINSPLTLAQAATVQFVPALHYNGAVAPISFIATDNQGLNSAPASVTINNVIAVNDAPVLSLSTPTAPVENAAAEGNVITTASATDVENNTLTFSLVVGSNPNAYYAIDATTGVVTLTAAGATFVNNGAAVNDLSLVRVSVTDGTTPVESSVPVPPTIDMNDVPVLSLTTPTAPVENAAAAGNVITTASATDEEGDGLDYSLVPGSNPNGYYAINANTGEVTLTAAGAAHVNAGNDLPALEVSVTEVVAGGATPLTDTETIGVPLTTRVNDRPILGDGIVTTPVGAGGDQAYGMSLQPDGKILMAGQTNNGSNLDFALTRYNANGSLDTSFGTGGIVTTAIGLGDDQARALVLQADGKIVVLGESSIGGNFDIAITRYNSDGSLDTSFGTAGIVTTAIGTGEDRGQSVTVQADGKLLVSGYSTIGGNFDFTMVRYNTDGTLDTSFGGGDGIVTTAIGTVNDVARSITLQPDGKILVGGQRLQGGNQDFALVRYNADGTLDTSFSDDGIVVTAVGLANDRAYSVNVQTDGKILLAGDSSNDFALVRYNSDGSLDTSFGGGDGIVTTDISGGTDVGRAMTIQSDGKILVVGQMQNGGTGGTDFALLRYNSDGSLDSTFGGGDGIVFTAISTGTDIAQAVRVQPDGKIVLSGYARNGINDDFALARYNSDGTLDITFDAQPGQGVAFTEGGAAVVLNAGMQVLDEELSAANNFDGAFIYFGRNGGGNSDDVFGFDGVNVTTSGNNVLVGGVAVGTFGVFVVGFFAVAFAGTNATQAHVNTVMQNIVYSNSSDAPPASVTIDWTFDDGNQGAQGSGGGLTASSSSTLVHIIPTNDAPMLASETIVGHFALLYPSPPAQSVGVALSVLMPAVSDVDIGDTLAGYAVTSAASESSNGGVWQYQAAGTSTWTALSSASATNAIFLAPDTKVRWSVATTEAFPTTELKILAVDSSAGVPTTGDVLNASVTGGSTRFSNPATMQVVYPPVVIDLNRDGVLSYSQLAMDVDDDGTLDQTAWAGAQDGVLVWDKYGDGLVHDSSQFEFTQYGGRTDLEGLAAGFDSNRDGLFNALDAKFGEFRVWQDTDQDGVSDAGEVRSLADWGLTGVHLSSDGVVRTPAPGVTEAGRTTATATDGTQVLVGDVAFAYRALDYSVQNSGQNSDQGSGHGAQLALLGAGMDLHFSSFVAVHGPVSALDLNGTGANSLKLSLSDVLSQAAVAVGVEPGGAVLVVDGGSDDRLALSHTEGWQQSGTSAVSGAGAVYNVWEHTATAHQVWVHQHLQVI